MTKSVQILSEEFLQDRQGRTFSDLLGDSPQILAELLAFFNDENRQRRMQEAEIHHDRAALAGVVRELECHPAVDALLSANDPRRSQRLRQAVGVLVRMIMEKLGWQKTGKKGSLGVRSDAPQHAPYHNTGGLAFWFLRAERYELVGGMPYVTVKKRCRGLRNSRKESNGAEKSARSRTARSTSKDGTSRGTR